MKIKDYWENWRKLTSNLTESTRKLAFGAAAICWFFKKADYTFPPKILLSLLFIVFFFIFDILQFFIQIIKLKKWIRKKEDEIEEQIGDKKLEEHEIGGAPVEIYDLPDLFFYMKVVSLFIAFFMLILQFLLIA